MNYIDAHSHVWTPDTAHYPLAAGFRRAIMQPPSFTVEELQTEMKEVGVNRVVLIQMSFYGYDNSYMLDTIERFPGQFAGVAVIDQNGLHPEVRMGRLKKQGVTGFRIYPKDQPVAHWLDNEGLRKMFAYGAKEQLNMCCLIDPDALPALDKTCREFPDTPVVIDHLCRIGVDGTVHEADVKALCNMAQHKQVTGEDFRVLRGAGKKKPPYTDLAPLIRQVYDAYGPERLMWATDCPFQVVDHTYRQSFDLIAKNLDFLSADDKEWILGKTAQRVFFRG